METCPSLLKQSDSAGQAHGVSQAFSRGQAIAVVATAVEQAVCAAGGSVQVDLQCPDVS